MADQTVIRTIRVRGVPEGIDELTGKLKQLAGAQENVALVSEQSAKRTLSLEAAYKKQTMQLDENARNQARIASATKVADGALREGLITQQQHAERLNLISQRYAAATVQAGKFAGQTGLNRYELLNLSRQMQDVGVSLASGQSPFVVLTQQGSQILDVFQATTGTVRGFFSQAIGWAGRFATSAAGVATGVGAIAGAALYAASSWSTGQREIDKALIGIGQRSGATADSVNKIAEAIAGSSRLSVSESRSAALEFVKTGNIYEENIGALVSLVKGHAIAIGQSSEEAAKQLAKIFGGDIAEGADKLNAVYGSISGATRQYAVELDVLGKRQEAIALLAKEVAPAIQKASDVTSFWAKSWDVVGNASSNAFDKVGKGLANLTGVGLSRQDQLGNAQNALKIGEAGLRDQQELAAVIGPDLVPGLKQAQEAVEKLREEVARLNKEIAVGGAETGQSRILKIGQDADAAVRALVPFIEQLEKVAKAQELIRKAQGTPGAQQGLAGSNAEAARAGDMLAINIKNTREQTDRANKVALELVKTYNTGSSEVAKTLDLQKDQLAIANAVGGGAKLAAQEQATYNKLIRDGMGGEDAMRVAAKDRAIAQSQINAKAQEQLFSLQNQFAVASAVTGVDKLRAQEQATYNQLVRDGVDVELAGKIAAQERANSQAQITAAAANQLFQLQNQLPVLSAVTGQQQIQAQYQATINQLIRDSVPLVQAVAIAEAQRSASIAQVNTGIAQETRALEDQLQMLKAKWDGESRAAAADIAYRRAKDAGASDSRAAALSEAAYNLQAEQDFQEGARMRAQARKQAEAAWDREREAIAKAKAELEAYLQKAKFVPFAFSGGNFTVPVFITKEGTHSQFDPKGYAQKIETPQLQFAKTVYGAGGYDTNFQPNATGIANLVNSYLAGNQTIATAGWAEGGGVMGAIEGLLNGQTMGGGVMFGGGGLSPDTLQIVQRLTELLPDDQKAGVIEREIAMLRAQPQNLETLTAIKQLTDSLTQLRQSTDTLADTMTDVLSPFYSQDPRQTHLGFRAFAGGGIMTPYGELPLKKYDGGGIASSAQVSVFGEGSTPEAYVPVPSGRIPVVIQQPANSNDRTGGRPIFVSVSMTASVSRDEARKTGFQIAQSMKRALG